MRALILAAFVTACGAAGGAPSPRAPDADDCSRAKSLAAHADALASDGFLDRAEVKMREADAACPALGAHVRLAAITAELERADEDVDQLLAHATAAERSGDKKRARALRDRALRRLEKDEHASARVVPAEADGVETHVEASPDGAWFVIGRTLVAAKDGASHPLPGDVVKFDDAGRWIAVSPDEGPLTILSLPALALVAELRGTRAYVTPVPGKNVLVASVSRGDKETSFVVDVDARTARDVKGAGALDEGLVFDATRHWAIWPGESRTWIVDLETASARTIDIVAATVQPAGDVIVVEGGDEVRVVTLATGVERFRMSSITWSISTDGKRFVWAPKTPEGSHKLHIRDLERGGERRLTTMSPPKDDCQDGIWAWQAVLTADGALDGTACYSDFVHVNLTTGHARLTREEGMGEGEGDGGYYDQQLASCKQLGAVHCDDGYIVSTQGRSILPFADGVATIDPKTERRAVLLPESQLVDLRDQTHAAIGKDAVALIDASGRARVWNDKNGSVLYRSEAQAEPVAFAAFAGDGAELVTLAPHGVVRRWNVRTGELLSTRALRSCVAAALAIAPDGTPLVACDDDHAVVVWDAAKSIILAERDGVMPALDGANRTVALFRTDDRSAVDVVPLDGGAAKTFKINGMYSATAVAIGSGRVAVASGALAVIIDVKSGAEVARRGDVRNTGFTLSSDGAWAVYESHAGARALRLDHGGAAPEPIVLPEGRDLRRFAVEGGTVVASNANHEVFAWTIDPPARTLALRPTADVLALSSDGARIVLGTRGVKIADRDGLGNARTLLAVPYTNAGVSFAANERPAIFGNPIEAGALLRCAVGDVVLPYASCLGRFAD